MAKVKITMIIKTELPKTMDPHTTKIDMTLHKKGTRIINITSQIALHMYSIGPLHKKIFPKNEVYGEHAFSWMSVYKCA